MAVAAALQERSWSFGGWGKAKGQEGGPGCRALLRKALGGIPGLGACRRGPERGPGPSALPTETTAHTGVGPGPSSPLLLPSSTRPSGLTAGHGSWLPRLDFSPSHVGLKTELWVHLCALWDGHPVCGQRRVVCCGPCGAGPLSLFLLSLHLRISGSSQSLHCLPREGYSVAALARSGASKPQRRLAVPHCPRLCSAESTSLVGGMCGVCACSCRVGTGVGMGVCPVGSRETCTC